MRFARSSLWYKKIIVLKGGDPYAMRLWCLDSFQNFAKNWLCDSIFRGRYDIFVKEPLFWPTGSGFSTMPVKGYKSTQRRLSHCGIHFTVPSFCFFVVSCALCIGSGLYIFPLVFLILLYCSFPLFWSILRLIWLYLLFVWLIYLHCYGLVKFSLQWILLVCLAVHVRFLLLHPDKIEMNHWNVLAPRDQVLLEYW